MRSGNMNSQKGVRIFKGLLYLVLACLLMLFFIRLFLPSQIDDVSPGISCNEKLLVRSDVFFVIPNFHDEFDIANNSKWCEYIASFDKELALHGVYHTFEEFSIPRTTQYVTPGVTSFEKCFNKSPTRFKPPQLAWSKENDWLKDTFDVELFWNQLFHKVYHCEDTGLFPNWMIRLF